MQETASCRLTINKKPAFPTIALSVVCAVIVILSRALPSHSLVQIMGVSFPYTDIFVIAAAGIGGLGCGLLSFVMMFVGEFARVGGSLSLYSVSTEKRAIICKSLFFEMFT